MDFLMFKIKVRDKIKTRWTMFKFRKFGWTSLKWKLVKIWRFVFRPFEIVINSISYLFSTDDVRDAFKELEDQRSGVRKSSKAYRFVKKIKKKFPNKFKWFHVSVSWGSVDIIIRYEFDDMKYPVKILRWISKQGYRQTQEPSNQSESSLIRWYFGKKNKTVFQLMGVFDSSKEDACKFVQVGEEMKPIMKMQCPDGEKIPEEIGV